MNQIHPDTEEEVDGLIRKHLAELGETTDDGSRMAAVSASHKFSWAKQADVDIEFVNRRLGTICEKMSASTEKHWAVPRYRLKTG